MLVPQQALETARQIQEIGDKLIESQVIGRMFDAISGHPLRVICGYKPMVVPTVNPKETAIEVAIDYTRPIDRFDLASAIPGLVNLLY